MTESDLIQRCKEGDRTAQRDLYERTVSKIYRLLLRLTGDEHDAFDLAQETYIRAFEHIGRFDGNSTFATWLYRIAYNEALQFRRASSRRAEKTASLKVREDDSSDEPRSDLRMDFEDALARLSPDERAILLLRYHEGLDYRRIGEVLECAAGTVASRLNRARSQLRAILKKTDRITEER